MIAIIGLVMVLLGLLALVHVLALGTTVAVVLLVIGIVLIAVDRYPGPWRRP